MENKKTPHMIQSVERAMSILELLSKSQKPLSVSEISEALCINRTTVYGLLNTLISLDYVSDSDINNRFEITGKMYRLSYSYPNRLPVVRYAANYMIELAERLESVIHLGVLNQNNNVLLVNAQFPKNIRNARSGSLFPLHATGMGKVFLAYLPTEKAELIIENLELQQFTKYTITDRNELRKELERIRAQGYGRDNAEYMEHSACVAFPIFNENNNVVAALSITNTPDFIKEHLDAIITDGLACSKNCSLEMGWELYR